MRHRAAVARFSSRTTNRTRSMNQNPHTKSIVFTLIALAMLFMFSLGVQAHPYASGVTGTNAAGDVGFFMNEAGATVTVTFEDSSTLSLQSISSIAVPSGGSNYTAAPTVTITGGGRGGTATATVSGGVAAVTVTSGGSNYVSAPTVTFTGGGGSGAGAAATISAGVVTSVTVTNAGSGYTSAPTVGFTGGSGSYATATATLSASVTAVTVVNG